MGVEILGAEAEDFWKDHKGALINAIRTRPALERADVVVVKFGEKYRQWNAAFDAGYAAALGKQLIVLHPPEFTHALKEIDGAAQAVAAEPGSLGVVIGGSGNGEQIAANKVRGVRAALAWSSETATLARQHNDANVVGVGARMHAPEEAAALVDAFLAEPFSGDARHQRRIDQLGDYETTGELPPLPQ